MLRAYIPILLFVLIAVGFAIFTLLVSRLVHAEKPNAVKLEPYECGIEPSSDARDRYSIRYYLIAMLFVIFDVETMFMFPWAVSLDRLALFGLDRDVRLPVHPGCRLLLRVEEGRARVAIDAAG